MDDHVIPDLKRALKALDQVPNELPIQGTVHSIGVVDVAVSLSHVIEILENNNKLAGLEDIRLLLKRGNLALKMGNVEDAARLQDQARQALESYRGGF